MKTLRYKGTSTVRVLRTRDFEAAGVEDQQTISVDTRESRDVQVSDDAANFILSNEPETDWVELDAQGNEPVPVVAPPPAEEEEAVSARTDRRSEAEMRADRQARREAARQRADNRRAAERARAEAMRTSTPPPPPPAPEQPAPQPEQPTPGAKAK